MQQKVVTVSETFGSTIAVSTVCAEDCSAPLQALLLVGGFINVRSPRWPGG